MRARAALPFLLALPGLMPGEVVEYEILRSADSRFRLQVHKTGLMSGKKHEFVFENYRGTVFLDRAAPEASRVELIIDGASAVCTDTWVSQKDLKKIQAAALNEMMAVERHPSLLFSSTGVSSQGGNRFVVEGALTVRGISKPAAVQVLLSENPDGSLGFSGKAEIRLKDYGLKPPGALLGAIGTKNEMSVEFTLIGRRRDGGHPPSPPQAGAAAPPGGRS